MERVQAGESPEDVIQALGFNRSCIYDWLARYRAGGWDGLKAKPLAGRPKKITGAQIKYLYQAIAGKTPLQHRFEFALWTLRLVPTLAGGPQTRAESADSRARRIRVAIILRWPR